MNIDLIDEQNPRKLPKATCFELLGPANHSNSALMDGAQCYMRRRDPLRVYFNRHLGLTATSSLAIMRFLFPRSALC